MPITMKLHQGLLGLPFGSLVALLASLACESPASGQNKYVSAEAAYSAGANFLNSGNLAAGREAMEEALKLAKNDIFRIKVNRALLIPYRELQEIGPMQKAGEYIIANSQQAAERSLTRDAVLAFVFKRGKLDAAIEEYEARLKNAPDDSAVLFLLAEAYGTYKKDPKRSAELLEKLAALDKKGGKGQDVAGQAQLAQQYVKAGKHKEGAEKYEAIAPLDSKLEAWHYKEAAAAWLKAGDKAKAIAAAKKSAVAPPEKRSELLTYFWSRGLADAFLDGGEPALAIPHYQAALASTTIEGYRKDTQARMQQAQNAAAKR